MHHLLRTYIVVFFFITSTFTGLHAQSTVAPVVPDRLSPAASVSLIGYLNKPLDAAYENRILAQDIERLLAPFRDRSETHWWQSEFWGKWFTSAIQAYRYHPTEALRAKIDSAAYGLLATQTADGYIGNYAVTHRLQEWDIWGRKYSMLGLLAYYELTGEHTFLHAVSRMADHLMAELAERNVRIVTQGNYRGMAASSVLEPIVLLYKYTTKRKYLDFAEAIVQQWETAEGPQLISKSAVPVAKRFPYARAANWVTQGQKAYEMMSCYEGLVELYRITGNPVYKTAVENTWQSIRDTEIDVLGSGSASECWFDGRRATPYAVKHADETCVTATWIKLNQQLLRLTGDVRYAEAIEQSYYNSLLGAMKPDGSTWSMYSPQAGVRRTGSNQCEMGLNCCVASGPRGLYTLPFLIAMSGDEGITVNFYEAGATAVYSPLGQEVHLEQTSRYPLEGEVSIRLEIPKAEKFTVALRIPSWSKRSTVKINGISYPVDRSGAYLSINRDWNNNDQIELSLDMRSQLHTWGEAPVYFAVQRGPLMLALDRRYNAGIALEEVITPVPDSSGYFVLVTSMPNKDSLSAPLFVIPCVTGLWRFGEEELPKPVYFTPYAHAGGTFDERSRYRVWLEQLIDPTETGL